MFYNRNFEKKGDICCKIRRKKNKKTTAVQSNLRNKGYNHSKSAHFLLLEVLMKWTNEIEILTN